MASLWDVGDVVCPLQSVDAVIIARAKCTLASSRTFPGMNVGDEAMVTAFVDAAAGATTLDANLSQFSSATSRTAGIKYRRTMSTAFHMMFDF